MYSYCICYLLYISGSIFLIVCWLNMDSGSNIYFNNEIWDIKIRKIPRKRPLT